MIADTSRKAVNKPTRGAFAVNDEWARGYYCAVAALLRVERCVTNDVRDLFAHGGCAERADPEDMALFRQHGLME